MRTWSSQLHCLKSILGRISTTASTLFHSSECCAYEVRHLKIKKVANPNSTTPPMAPPTSGQLTGGLTGGAGGWTGGTGGGTGM